MDRPQHFLNCWVLRTPWCYKTTKCVEVPRGGEGRQAVGIPCGKLGFQRSGLTGQVLELGETASLKRKHSNLGSLEELQHQE